MTRGAIRQLAVFALIGPSLATLNEAEACSFPAEPPKLVGYPADGAKQVPTDVAPLYQIAPAGAPLEKAHELVAESGEVVAVDRIPSGDVWHYAFRPRAALEPNQRYVFRAVGSQPGDINPRLEFTTGDGPVTEPVPPPEIRLEHYFFEQALQSSCSPQGSGTCFAFEGAPGNFLEIAQYSSEVEGLVDTFVYLLVEPLLGLNLSGVSQGTPYDCARLRTRAANGTYSDSVEVCRADGVLYAISGSENIACSSAGLTHDGELVSQDAPASPGPAESSSSTESGGDAGCAVRSPSPGTFSGGAILLGFGVLGALRRRRGPAHAARRAASSKRRASAREAEGALPPASMRDNS